MAKHGFEYVQGLKPRVTPKPLLEGSVAHAGWGAGYEVLQAIPLSEARRDPDGALGLMLEVAWEAAQASYETFMREKLVDVRADALADLAEEAQKTLELERWMVRHFFEATKDDIGRLVILAVEHPFTIPIPNRIGRRGHLQLTSLGIDMLAFDTATGLTAVHEHKTMSANVDNIDRRLEMDPQTTGYIHGVRFLTGPYAGGHPDSLLPAYDKAAALHGLNAADFMRTGLVAYNVQRKKIPSAPKVNKDGTVSVAAIDTLPDIYLNAVGEQVDFATWSAGKKDRVKAAASWATMREKQDRIIEDLTSKGDTFFLRREYHRTDAEIERWREECWIDAARIREAKRDPRKRTRNPGHCTMPWSLKCRFHDLCLDPDNEEIRSREFTTRDERAKALTERNEAEAKGPEEEFGW
jgi:hypothetical protein